MELEILMHRKRFADRLDDDVRPIRVERFGDLQHLRQVRNVRLEIGVAAGPADRGLKSADFEFRARQVTAGVLDTAEPHSLGEVLNIDVDAAEAMGQGDFEDFALPPGQAQGLRIEIAIHAVAPRRLEEGRSLVEDSRMGKNRHYRPNPPIRKGGQWLPCALGFRGVG